MSKGSEFVVRWDANEIQIRHKKAAAGCDAALQYDDCNAEQEHGALSPMKFVR